MNREKFFFHSVEDMIVYLELKIVQILVTKIKRMYKIIVQNSYDYIHMIIWMYNSHNRRIYFKSDRNMSNKFKVTLKTYLWTLLGGIRVHMYKGKCIW